MGETHVRELSERELEDIVAELPRRPLMAGREGMRLSLAGSQSKLPVLIRNAAIALPLGNTPSTHIIKPWIFAASAWMGCGIRTFWVLPTIRPWRNAWLASFKSGRHRSLSA